MKRFCLLFIAFICIYNGVLAQEKDFSVAEYNMLTVYSKITRYASEDENLKNNKIFIDLLDSILRIPESFSYAFSGLNIGNVTAPDKSFRILTWYMVHTNGTYENFGFIQCYKKDNTVDVYFLKDMATSIKNPTMANCTPDSWFGAMYYDILEHTYNGITTYFLLGWRANTIYTQKKVIETFRFDKKNKPTFGYQQIEQKSKGFKKRIIFEYAASQTMMLRYEKRKRMIVLDHLAPSDKRYENIFEFYGPDFSIDGYKYKQGKWQYISDIDLHSRRQKFSDYIPEKLKREKKREDNGLN